MTSVFILKDTFGQIWGVYSTRDGAEYHHGEAMSKRDEDLFIEEWELDLAWGDRGVDS
jgi:hypothetical protein